MTKSTTINKLFIDNINIYIILISNSTLETLDDFLGF